MKTDECQNCRDVRKRERENFLSVIEVTLSVITRSPDDAKGKNYEESLMAMRDDLTESIKEISATSAT